MGDDSDRCDSMGDDGDRCDSVGDDSDKSDSMGEDYVYDSEDWRTTLEAVDLEYTEEDNLDGTRYYPSIRRRADEEKISPEDEYLHMKKQVAESKGFDIDFTKFRCVFNYKLADLDLENQFVYEPETTRGLLDRLSRNSLKRFNKTNSTNYEFVKVIKANYHLTAGIMFFITFEGKLLNEDDSKLFQAKIRYCGRTIDIVSCELKPEKKVHSIEAPDKEHPKKPRLTLEPSYV